MKNWFYLNYSYKLIIIQWKLFSRNVSNNIILLKSTIKIWILSFALSYLKNYKHDDIFLVDYTMNRPRMTKIYKYI